MRISGKGRTVEIDRLELRLPAAAGRQLGGSEAAMTAFARSVATELGRRWAEGDLPAQARKIEVAVPYGVASATGIARAVERKLNRGAGAGNAVRTAKGRG